jgi:hypothetical protein
MAEYKNQRLRVDATPEHPEGWAEFVGKKVADLLVLLGQSGREIHHGFFELYETANEGYKLYAVESVTYAQNDVRPLGQRAAGGNTARALYLEEEAKRRYPEFFAQLLESADE